MFTSNDAALVMMLELIWIWSGNYSLAQSSVISHQSSFSHVASCVRALSLWLTHVQQKQQQQKLCTACIVCHVQQQQYPVMYTIQQPVIYNMPWTLFSSLSCTCIVCHVHYTAACHIQNMYNTPCTLYSSLSCTAYIVWHGHCSAHSPNLPYSKGIGLSEPALPLLKVR